MGAHLAGFLNNARCMQQRFGRNTAYIQANPAESRVTLDQGHFKAKIGGTKSSGVAAGTGAQYYKIDTVDIIRHDG